MENTINGTMDKKQILHPVKIIALNQNIFFCYVINQSIIVYAAGCNIILENIRNHQQIIIWVNQDNFEIQTINKYQCAYGQTRMALLIKNKKINCHIMRIFDIDWSSYFHRQSSTKQIKLHQYDYAINIKVIEFDQNGQNMAIIQQQCGICFLSFYCTNEQKIIAKIKLQMSQIKGVRSFSFKDQQYFAIYNAQQIILYKVACRYYQIAQKLNSSVQELLNTLDNKFTKQEIIQLEFDSNQKGKILMFILTSSGQFKIGCLKHNGFQNFVSYNLCLTDQLSYQSQTTKTKNKLFYPSAFTNHNNKVIFGYRKCRKVSYITYSLLNYAQHTITRSEDVLFYESQERYQNNCRQQYEQRQLTVNKVVSSSDNCIYAFIVKDQTERITIMIVDTLRSLTHPQIIDNPSQKIFGNISCHGKCHSVAHLQLSSGFFVLQESKQTEKSILAFYCIDYGQLGKLRPASLVQWKQYLKIKTLDVQVHELNNMIALIHEQTVKIHYYSRQKLYQCFVTLNLPNCQCCAFTPLGDKILLATLSGIFIAGAHTFEVITVINSSSYQNRVPCRFTKISPYSMGLQACSGNNFYLYDINLLNGMTFLGSFQSQTLASINLQNRKSTKNQILAIDQRNQIVIEADINQQLRFYNFMLQKINSIKIDISCLSLYCQIDILFIGTSNGNLFLCKYPEVMGASQDIFQTNLSSTCMIACIKIHSQSIASIKLCSNYRYIYSITSNGQISITEFIQQHSASLSRAASLTLLKRSSIKPIHMMYTITSMQIQNRRVQNKIKMIGKQVQVQKSNEKAMEIARHEIDKKIVAVSNNFQKEAIQKLENCSQQIICKETNKKVAEIRNQLMEFERNSKINLPRLIQYNLQELKDVFQYKSTLEEKLQKIMSNFDKKMRQFVDGSQSEYLNLKNAFQMQLSIINKGLISNQHMNKKYKQINAKIQIEIQEDYYERKIIQKSQLQQQLTELKNNKNNLRNSIRILTFNIAQIQDKRRVFALRTAEVYSQLKVLKQPDEIFNSNVHALQQQLLSSKNKNRRLMDEHRQQQRKKQETQKQANYSQSLYNSLLKQIKELQYQNIEVQKKNLQLDDEFFMQNSKNIQLSENLAQMQQKLIKLRNQRDQVKRKAILKKKKVSRSLMQRNGEQQYVANFHKNNLKTSSKLKKSKFDFTAHQSSHYFPKKLNNKENIVDFNINNFVGETTVSEPYNKADQNKQQLKLDKHLFSREAYCQKIERMNKIKNQKIKKCIIINDKLVNDNKKLTSQLNQIRRYNEFLMKRQAKLKLQIKRGSLQITNKSEISTPKNDSFISSYNNNNNSNSNSISKKIKNSDNNKNSSKNIKSNSNMICISDKNNNNKSGVLKNKGSKLLKRGVFSLYASANFDHQQF